MKSNDKKLTDSDDSICGHDVTLTRRKFCNGLVLSGAGLAIAAQGTVAAGAKPQVRGVSYPPMKIQGASELMPGSAMLFNYPRNSDPAILARTDDHNFYAYSQKCSHLGCSVHFSRAVNRLDCPCHRGSFDVRSGGAVNGPPRRGLDEIILQLRGGEVWAIGRRSELDNPIVV